MAYIGRTSYVPLTSTRLRSGELRISIISEDVRHGQRHDTSANTLADVHVYNFMSYLRAELKIVTRINIGRHVMHVNE